VTLREAANHNNNDYNESCQQDCFPATWRTEVVRGILLKQEKSPPPQPATISSSQQQRTTLHQNSVHVVSTFLQSILHHGPSSIRDMGDCTHKSLDAVIMLNEQLIHHAQGAGKSILQSPCQPIILIFLCLPANDDNDDDAFASSRLHHVASIYICSAHQKGDGVIKPPRRDVHPGYLYLFM